MAIYSVAFLGIVFIFLLVHEIVGRIKSEYQWTVRLLASLAFYLYAAGGRIIFVLLSAVSIYLSSKWIDNISQKGRELRKAEGITKEEKKLIKTKTQNKKRWVLFGCIFFNLIILLLVKYILPTKGFSIILPLGISFYTLQAIAYMVDVYGDKYKGQQNFAKLLLYLMWFPQLIQGPVNRYDAISEQLYKPHSLTVREFRYAFYLFLFGALKRYVVGDLLSPMVTEILGAQSVNYPGSYLLFGAFLFAIEQYANFSGGIDMVMGVSMLYGVSLAENFRQPYFSKTLAEFWRRWHISLGAWMRDYVFYPFAMTKTIQKFMKKISAKFGNHCGRAVVGGIGNLIVFALVGYWHGPQLHYLAWGLYNGVIIAVSDALSPVFEKIREKLHIAEDNKIWNCFQIFRTFMIIVFAGYFDVVDTVSVGIKCFINTFLHFDAQLFVAKLAELTESGVIGTEKLVVIIMGIVIMITFSVIREKKTDVIEKITDAKLAPRWVLCYLMLFLFLYSFTLANGSGGFMYAAF